jgi:hypothetical protein
MPQLPPRAQTRHNLPKPSTTDSPAQNEPTPHSLFSVPPCLRGTFLPQQLTRDTPSHAHALS